MVIVNAIAWGVGRCVKPAVAETTLRTRCGGAWRGDVGFWAYTATGCGSGCVGQGWLWCKRLGATRRRICARQRALAALLILRLLPAARRPRLLSRAGADPQTFKELKGWKVATPSDWARSRRMVGVLSRSQARLPAQTGRNLQPDGGRAGRLLRAGARAHPRSASRVIPDRIGDLQRRRARITARDPARAGAIARPPDGSARTRRPSFRSSPGPGISTFGARCGDRSRAMRPARKPAPPISTMPSLRRRGSSPSLISICARRIRCTTCSFATRSGIQEDARDRAEPIQSRLSPSPRAMSRRPRRRSSPPRRKRSMPCVQRAQFEHAIAMLIGRPPAELSIGPHRSAGSIPKIPVTVPSALLERRPDIAAAERTMQEQNALIGVAIAGYFPDISLSAVLQWTGSQPAPFKSPTIVWSLGAAGTQVLFEGGFARRASRRRARGLLAKRRQLSADRAHRVSAGRGSARRRSPA